MGVNIDSSNIRDLSTDFSSVPARATYAAADEVSKIADQGHKIAKTSARRTAGAHGRHYHRAITKERQDALGLSWVYGPERSMVQGDMSFEWGSRNQKPHRDLNISADIIGPRLPRVADAMARTIHGR